MLILEPIDSADVSRQLAMEGSRSFRHLEVKTSESLVLAADVDQEGNFRLGEIAELLKELAGDMAFLGKTGRHFESASLFPLQALRSSGEMLEPNELAERARGLRQQTLTKFADVHKSTNMEHRVETNPEYKDRPQEAGDVGPNPKRQGQTAENQETTKGASLDQLKLPKQVATVEQMKALQRNVISLNDQISLALEPFVKEFETVLSEANFGVSLDLRVNQQTADVCNYVSRRLERGFVCPKEAQSKGGTSGEEIAATLRCYSAPGQPEGVISFEHSRKDGPGRHSHGGFFQWARLTLTKLHKAIMATSG